MNWDLIVTIVHIISCVVVIFSILLQSANTAGLGAIGGDAETFFGKNKGKTLDAILRKITTIMAILFVATSLVLSLVLPVLNK